VITTTHNLDLDGVGVVDLSVDDRGHGQPFLLLHGGAGPQSVLPFAERFAAGKDVRVITPTHPGFRGTTRPAGLESIAKLAALYQNSSQRSMSLTSPSSAIRSAGGSLLSWRCSAHRA
jgi:pimeloyl-ACP methyl ester carboxylesterase